MEHILLVMILVLFGTKVAGTLSVRLKQPAVLGKLLVGILLGPAMLHVIEPSEFIELFSSIGVLLLMFLAGLETDATQLKENWKPSFFVALFGILLPFVGGWLVAYWVGFTMIGAIFLGVLFSATSVSITVQVLKELEVMHTKEATTILGAAVVDDILVVTLLAFVLSMAGESVSISGMLLKKVLFFVGIYVMGKYLVAPFLTWMHRFKVTQPLAAGSLIVCFFFALFGEALGMEGIIGTFLAGLVIAQTPYQHEVEAKIDPIANALFVPFFYISVGLNIQFVGIADQWLFIVVATLIGLVTKLFGGYLGARITGFSKASSLSVGSGMISRGEVALIIGAIGLSGGLIPQNYYTSIILAVLLTTLLAPPLVTYFFKKQY